MDRKVERSDKNVEELTIFFDGKCPMCMTEMLHLKSCDSNNQIRLIDIHQPEEMKCYPSIQFDAAMSILHGLYQGNLLLGLAVTHRAWTIVGKGFWVAPLAWPVIKTISHQIYLLVAKHRHPISSFLSKVFGLKASPCRTGVCYRSDDDEKVRNNHWRQ